MKISVIAGAGMGGTEKAAYLYASELSRRGHQVEALTDEEGCRSELLTNAGVRIREVERTHSALMEYFQSYRPDIVHNHTSGYSDQSVLYEALRKLGKHRPKLVETNVFGQLLDYQDKNDVDARLFISMTSGMQAYRRTRIIEHGPNAGIDNVVFYPLPEDAYVMDHASGIALRKSLDIGDDEVLAIRIGRPSPKWEDWECQVFQQARKQNPKLKLLLMEPKPSLAHDIESGKYGDGIIIKQANADPDILRQVYSAADLMLQASSFGESFGYTLAEGMAASLPIITLSTPWGDQAQTELIEHGRTGFVCRSITGMASALVELTSDRTMMESFGKAAPSRIRGLASLDHEVSVLEETFHNLISSSSSHKAEKRFKEWEAFIAQRSREKVPCFEMDHNMSTALFFSAAYARYRHLKHLIKYLVKKLSGRKVYAPHR